MKRVRCRYCDRFVKLENIQKGYEYHCPNCESLIYRPGESPKIIAVISLSTLIVFFWAVNLPLLSVYVLDDNQVSIIQSLDFLFQTDVFSGVILSITIIVIPVFMILLTLLIIFHKFFRISLSFLKNLIGLYIYIKEWNMIEVYFVGLLISMVKLVELSDMTILLGFWVNMFYVLLLYLSLVLFNPYDILHIHKRKPIDNNSLKKTLIFLILAIIFILPANLLPIMPTFKYSVEYPNTIFDGIKAFYDEGDLFVSGVVFFTSMCIPLIKIIGIIVMMFMVKYNIFLNHKKFATKFYIVADTLGKYSMLDVYVVVLASAFIQYDDLVRIEIGEAIIPFTFVVFFTMIASKNFDTRLLWKRRKND